MQTAENTGLLSGLIGPIQTNVGVTQSDLTRIGLTVFVAVCLIFLAWFTFQKAFK